MGKKMRFLAGALGVITLGFASVNAAPASCKLGFDVSLVMPEVFNGTFGWGGILDYGWNLGSAGEIHFHPNVEMWYARAETWYNPNNPNNPNGTYYHFSDFETTLNFEGRYNFPLPQSFPIHPYVGVGPGIILSYFSNNYPPNVNWAWPYYHESGVDVGFNLMGGIDFKIGSNISAFGEIKGKIGGPIDVFKMTFGMMFPIGGAY